MTAAEEIAKEAEARGREEGRRDLLVKLITLRFESPNDATMQLLRHASAEQLSRCAELVLTAASVDEVLAPCR
jgi:hypothetical protein